MHPVMENDKIWYESSLLTQQPLLQTTARAQKDATHLLLAHVPHTRSDDVTIPNQPVSTTRIDFDARSDDAAYSVRLDEAHKKTLEGLCHLLNNCMTKVKRANNDNRNLLLSVCEPWGP